MPIHLRHPSDADVEALLTRVSNHAPTYPEIGASGHGTLPTGYRTGRCSMVLGYGPAVFERGKDALRGWRAHRGAGALLRPPVPELVVGTDMVTLIRLGPLWVVAPCRIVYVTNTATSFGFGYGTLPGHPESGEESFHVHLDAQGEVAFTIIFFARIVDPLAKVGSPVARMQQRRVTRLYLASVGDAVAGDG
jgi:uncharacterized protein (UPF0548 family)